MKKNILFSLSLPPPFPLSCFYLEKCTKTDRVVDSGENCEGMLDDRWEGPLDFETYVLILSIYINRINS